MARVLIAEDDPDIRALVARRVSQLGHDIVEAADGDSALALTLAKDVVLVDAYAKRVRSNAHDVGL